MKTTRRLAALIATAAGAGLVAQAAFAGPGCNHAGMKPSGYQNGYQPAIYQLTPGDRASTRRTQGRLLAFDGEKLPW